MALECLAPKASPGTRALTGNLGTGAALLLLTAVLYMVARSNYLLFHTVAEGFAILVAGLIYVLGTRTFRYSGSPFLLFLANAYFFVAVLDFFHTMTYKGMGIFPEYGANTPTQLWIAGRYVDALSLLAAPFFAGRPFPRRLTPWVYAMATVGLLASILWLDLFPACFVEGQGLTPFKVGSEYIISLLLLGAILHLRARRHQLRGPIFRLTAAAMAVTIASELSFTLYTDVYGVMNFLGHIFKIVAYYLLYQGIVLSGIDAPYMEVKRLNDELEGRVRERTAQLEVSNRKLEGEVEERQQAEEEIRKLNESLARWAKELSVVNKELEAFSYSVSHDLKAPLRAIDGFSRALLEDCSERLDAEGKEHLHRVRAASQRMGQLIDALLELSRVTRGEMRRERVDLTDLARAIATELQGTQPEREVEFAIAPGLAAEGDERLLRVALENLLGNAWKFAGTRPRARIEFGATRMASGAVYFVRDDGEGFDMAYAGKLFGAFQRLHSEREFPGTGIGLATVQRVVHRHGGRVWAEGETGKGATFYFTLFEAPSGDLANRPRGDYYCPQLNGREGCNGLESRLQPEADPR